MGSNPLVCQRYLDKHPLTNNSPISYKQRLVESILPNGSLPKSVWS
jgi:hypothetical protein